MEVSVDRPMQLLQLLLQEVIFWILISEIERLSLWWLNCRLLQQEWIFFVTDRCLVLLLLQLLLSLGSPHLFVELLALPLLRLVSLILELQGLRLQGLHELSGLLRLDMRGSLSVHALLDGR